MTRDRIARAILRAQIRHDDAVARRDWAGANLAAADLTMLARWWASAS